MEITISASQHDEYICGHIGQAVGQSGWPIEHRGEEGGNVTLIFPDSVSEQAVRDAIQSYRPPALAPRPPSIAERVSALEAEVAELKANRIA